MKSKMKRIYLHYGFKAQLKQMEEEIVEFCHAVIKHRKYNTSETLQEVKNELADMMNVDQQFRTADEHLAMLNGLPVYAFEIMKKFKDDIEYYYDLHKEEIKRIMERKLDRTLLRIAGER